MDNQQGFIDNTNIMKTLMSNPDELSKNATTFEEAMYRASTSFLQQQQLHQQQQQQQQQQPDNQMNPQMQPMNMQNSVSSMQPTAATSMHHGAMPPLANHLGVSSAQTSLMNSLQPGSTLEPGQGNTSNSLQQVGVASLQQSSVNASQQANINTLSQSGGVSGLQANINPIQLSSNMIQHHQHLKQHQEQQQQHLIQTQQLKQQFQQCQMQEQLLQQQFQQLAHQQPKPQQSAQLQTGHQMPQLHQMNDDLKIRQGMGFKPGMTQQHLSAGHRAAYNHQLKSGASFPIFKTGTPLQSANSPFIVDSPSTPAMAASPIPGYPEKQTSGVSSLSNAGIGQPHSTASLAQVAIATPGLSASPLLAEFTGPYGNQGTASTIISGKSSVAEQPLDQLIKVNSVSSSKQCQEQRQLMQTPQRQMQHQSLIMQQSLQQQYPQLQQQFQQLGHQQPKPQQSAQLQTGHQMAQLQLMNDDLKIRQGMGFKPNMQNSVPSSKQSTAVTSTHDGAMPLLSNHMELSSAQSILSICNTNMLKLQCLEQQKQQLEQQSREYQMCQQWINLLSNHMELSSAQSILPICNTNMLKLQCLEQQKQQLEQQSREYQMCQQLDQSADAARTTSATTNT